MKVHFIAVGGSVMHNLAIALHKQGNQVSGSDDAFYSPSKERLAKLGLLPSSEGWDTSRITEDLDAVILGMHAKKDNPELLKAQSLNIPIKSFPEYVYEQTKNKTRIIVGGSHGKTSTTLMIMHVLQFAGKKFDYLVGSTAEGFNQAVHFSPNSEIAVIEGDEYLSSPLDLTPKFHHYRPHIGIITGIAWDHMNVFPTFENYKGQFLKYIQTFETNGKLIFFEDDDTIQELVYQMPKSVKSYPYTTPQKTENGIILMDTEIPLKVFGKHNIENLNAAWLACMQVGISIETFAEAISSFKGARKRLEHIYESKTAIAYSDFAHSPSKLKATVEAVREHYPNSHIVAIYELHTFSSVNPEFIPQYANTMQNADDKILYYDPEVIKKKGLGNLSPQAIKQHFKQPDLKVYTETEDLFKSIPSPMLDNTVYLFMSSGNFGGKQLKEFIATLDNAEQ